jgi:hypothetical protein
MADASDRTQRPPLRFMRLRDLVETSDDVISFVENYQKVWETEGRAMIALGEFLTLRSESMRYQVEMMKMGNDAFRRYNEWLEALMSLRPDTIMQAFMRPPERAGSAQAPAADPMADDRGEDAT